MCGRYVITSSPAAIRALFGYAEQPNFPPRYNVAPTQPIPIVRLDAGKPAFWLVRWGFLPSWVKDPRSFSLLVNARGESVIEKPAFRNAMRRRRCLIPADGFYEWKKLDAKGKLKQPYAVAVLEGPMLMVDCSAEKASTAIRVERARLHRRRTRPITQKRGPARCTERISSRFRSVLV